MLTYKPEEDNSPQEEVTESPVDEPKPLPMDDLIASNDAPEPAQPPPPPTFNSRDPDDLLVMYLILFFIIWKPFFLKYMLCLGIEFRCA